jgi:hypothetical protein
MSFLNTLEGITLDSTLRKRDKLIQAIELQRQAAEHESRREPFKPERAKRFSKWYFRHDGAWWSNLRIGHASLVIRGHTSFKGGATLEDLIAWYDEVIQDIRKGALDGEIEAVVPTKESSPVTKPKPKRGRLNQNLEVVA